jgi:hypothetical protein
MPSFLQALLCVASLSLGAVYAQDLNARKVWFDTTCRDKNSGVEVDKLWGIIQQMKTNAQDAAQAAQGNSGSKLYEHIFKQNTFAGSILSIHPVLHEPH